MKGYSRKQRRKINKNRFKHIVLIGLNFYFQRHSGDKNFWIDLIPLLGLNLNQITVLSVRENLVSTEQLLVNNCHMLIRYISPRFLEIGDVKRARLFWRKGAFPSWLGVIEKALNYKKICNELKKLYKENPYDHIHLMDNLGFVNQFIAKNVTTTVSVSAMAYQGKNRLFYDKYLSLSYDNPNLTVVPYSLSYAEKLRQIGIKEDRIVCIR